MFQITEITKLEYRIYFALIFLISIPLATFAWIACLTMNIFKLKTVQNEGIFKRAWGHTSNNHDIYRMIVVNEIRWLSYRNSSEP